MVDNHRVSVTQRQSALDALELAKAGVSGAAIKKKLEETQGDSVIYITVDTLKYLDVYKRQALHQSSAAVSP